MVSDIQNSAYFGSPQGVGYVKTKDFSVQRVPIFFTVDNDRFECYPALAMDSLVSLASITEVTETAAKIAAIVNQFKEVIQPESYERFMVRYRDKMNPIDHKQLIDILMWLLEQYGLRPTQRSSSSAPGSPDATDGSSSTDGAQRPAWSQPRLPQSAS